MTDDEKDREEREEFKQHVLEQAKRLGLQEAPAEMVAKKETIITAINQAVEKSGGYDMVTTEALIIAAIGSAIVSKIGPGAFLSAVAKAMSLSTGGEVKVGMGTSPKEAMRNAGVEEEDEEIDDFGASFAAFNRNQKPIIH